MGPILTARSPHGVSLMEPVLTVVTVGGGQMADYLYFYLFIYTMNAVQYTHAKLCSRKANSQEVS